MCLPVSMYSSRSITWADPQRERLTGPCVLSIRLLQSVVSVELSLVVLVVHPTKHHHTALLLVSVEKRGGGILEDSNNSTV